MDRRIQTQLSLSTTLQDWESQYQEVLDKELQVAAVLADSRSPFHPATSRSPDPAPPAQRLTYGDEHYTLLPPRQDPAGLLQEAQGHDLGAAQPSPLTDLLQEAMAAETQVDVPLGRPTHLIGRREPATRAASQGPGSPPPGAVPWDARTRPSASHSSATQHRAHTDTAFRRSHSVGDHYRPLQPSLTPPQHSVPAPRRTPHGADAWEWRSQIQPASSGLYGASDVVGASPEPQQGYQTPTTWQQGHSSPQGHGYTLSQADAAALLAAGGSPGRVRLFGPEDTQRQRRGSSNGARQRGSHGSGAGAHGANQPQHGAHQPQQWQEQDHYQAVRGEQGCDVDHTITLRTWATPGSHTQPHSHTIPLPNLTPPAPTAHHSSAAHSAWPHDHGPPHHAAHTHAHAHAHELIPAYHPSGVAQSNQPHVSTQAMSGVVRQQHAPGGTQYGHGVLGGHERSKDHQWPIEYTQAGKGPWEYTASGVAHSTGANRGRGSAWDVSRPVRRAAAAPDAARMDLFISPRRYRALARSAAPAGGASPPHAAYAVRGRRGGGGHVRGGVAINQFVGQAVYGAPRAAQSPRSPPQAVRLSRRVRLAAAVRRSGSISPRRRLQTALRQSAAQARQATHTRQTEPHHTPVTTRQQAQAHDDPADMQHGLGAERRESADTLLSLVSRQKGSTLQTPSSASLSPSFSSRELDQKAQQGLQGRSNTGLCSSSGMPWLHSSEGVIEAARYQTPPHHTHTTQRRFHSDTHDNASNQHHSHNTHATSNQYHHPTPFNHLQSPPQQHHHPHLDSHINDLRRSTAHTDCSQADSLASLTLQILSDGGSPDWDAGACGGRWASRGGRSTVESSHGTLALTVRDMLVGGVGDESSATVSPSRTDVWSVGVCPEPQPMHTVGTPQWQPVQQLQPMQAVQPEPVHAPFSGLSALASAEPVLAVAAAAEPASAAAQDLPRSSAGDGAAAAQPDDSGGTSAQALTLAIRAAAAAARNYQALLESIAATSPPAAAPPAAAAEDDASAHAATSSFALTDDGQSPWQRASETGELSDRVSLDSRLYREAEAVRQHSVPDLPWPEAGPALGALKPTAQQPQQGKASSPRPKRRAPPPPVPQPQPGLAHSPHARTGVAAPAGQASPDGVPKQAKSPSGSPVRKPFQGKQKSFSAAMGALWRAEVVGGGPRHGGRSSADGAGDQAGMFVEVHTHTDLGYELSLAVPAAGAAAGSSDAADSPAQQPAADTHASDHTSRRQPQAQKSMAPYVESETDEKSSSGGSTGAEAQAHGGLPAPPMHAAGEGSGSVGGFTRSASSEPDAHESAGSELEPHGDPLTPPIHAAGHGSDFDALAGEGALAWSKDKQQQQQPEPGQGAARAAAAAYSLTAQDSDSSSVGLSPAEAAASAAGAASQPVASSSEVPAAADTWQAAAAAGCDSQPSTDDGSEAGWQPAAEAGTAPLLAAPAGAHSDDGSVPCDTQPDCTAVRHVPEPTLGEVLVSDGIQASQGVQGCRPASAPQQPAHSGLYTPDVTPTTLTPHHAHTEPSQQLTCADGLLAADRPMSSGLTEGPTTNTLPEAPLQHAIQPTYADPARPDGLIIPPTTDCLLEPLLRDSAAVSSGECDVGSVCDEAVVAGPLAGEHSCGSVGQGSSSGGSSAGVAGHETGTGLRAVMQAQEPWHEAGAGLGTPLQAHGDASVSGPLQAQGIDAGLAGEPVASSAAMAGADEGTCAARPDPAPCQDEPATSTDGAAVHDAASDSPDHATSALDGEPAGTAGPAVEVAAGPDAPAHFYAKQPAAGQCAGTAPCSSNGAHTLHTGGPVAADGVPAAAVSAAAAATSSTDATGAAAETAAAAAAGSSSPAAAASAARDAQTRSPRSPSRADMRRANEVIAEIRTLRAALPPGLMVQLSAALAAQPRDLTGIDVPMPQLQRLAELLGQLRTLLPADGSPAAKGRSVVTQLVTLQGHLTGWAMPVLGPLGLLQPLEPTAATAAHLPSSNSRSPHSLAASPTTHNKTHATPTSPAPTPYPASSSVASELHTASMHSPSASNTDHQSVSEPVPHSIHAQPEQQAMPVTASINTSSTPTRLATLGGGNSDSFSFSPTAAKTALPLLSEAGHADGSASPGSPTLSQGSTALVYDHAAHSPRSAAASPRHAPQPAHAGHLASPSVAGMLPGAMNKGMGGLAGSLTMYENPASMASPKGPHGVAGAHGVMAGGGISAVWPGAGGAKAGVGSLQPAMQQAVQQQQQPVQSVQPIMAGMTLLEMAAVLNSRTLQQQQQGHSQQQPGMQWATDTALAATVDAAARYNPFQQPQLQQLQAAALFPPMQPQGAGSGPVRAAGSLTSANSSEGGGGGSHGGALKTKKSLKAKLMNMFSNSPSKA